MEADERELNLYCIIMKPEAAMEKFEVTFIKPGLAESFRMNHIQDNIHHVCVKVRADNKDFKYRYKRMGVD